MVDSYGRVEEHIIENMRKSRNQESVVLDESIISLHVEISKKDDRGRDKKKTEL